MLEPMSTMRDFACRAPRSLSIRWNEPRDLVESEAMRRQVIVDEPTKRIRVVASQLLSAGQAAVECRQHRAAFLPTTSGADARDQCAVAREGRHVRRRSQHLVHGLLEYVPERPSLVICLVCLEERAVRVHD